MKRTTTLFTATFFVIAQGLSAQCQPYWQQVGMQGFSTSSVSYCSIAVDGNGTPYVAFVDDTHAGRTTVMKYNGVAWDTVGQPGLSAGSVLWTSIAIDPNGTPYVTYVDGLNPPPFKATVKKFDGSNWVNVGSGGISAGTAYNTQITFAPDGTPYVGYGDVVNGVKASVMKFDGTNWVQVGAAGFSASNTHYNTIAIAPDGTPYVAYRDGAYGDAITVMKFDGSNWVNVGQPGFSSGQAYFTSIAIAPDGTPYVVYSDNGNWNRATVKKFNGSTWETVGGDAISGGNAFYTTIVIDKGGVPYVLYQDLVIDFISNPYMATVMKYDSTSWVPVGSPGFSAGNAQYTFLTIDKSQTLYAVYRDYNANHKATVMKFTLTPTITVNSATVCAGDPVTLVPEGGASYFISGGSFTVAPPVTTSYSVTGYAINGCTQTAIATVSVKPLPVIYIGAIDTLCANQSNTVVAVGAHTYTWNTGANDQVFVVSPSTTTTFSVQGTGINGCVSSNSITLEVLDCTGISEQENNSLSIYPNPGSGAVNIRAGQTIQKIEIFDHSGRLAGIYFPNDTIYNLKEETLAPGIYQLRIRMRESEVMRKVVVAP